MTLVTTEHTFELPRGLPDEQTGDVHRTVIMRLATGRDDLQASASPRVVENQRYKGIEVLSRVVLRIGGLQKISSSIIRRLFATDYYALVEEYNRLNYGRQPTLKWRAEEAFDTESTPIELTGKFVDEAGVAHLMIAAMRTARAEDEVLPWGDERVQRDPGFRPYIILSRVITSLSGVPAVNPASLQNLSLADLQTLWSEYNRLNYGEQPPDVAPGESPATPASSFSGR